MYVWISRTLLSFLLLPIKSLCFHCMWNFEQSGRIFNHFFNTVGGGNGKGGTDDPIRRTAPIGIPFWWTSILVDLSRKAF